MKIFYGIISGITLLIAIIISRVILNTEELDNNMSTVIQTIPIYWAVFSFSIKYLIEEFKNKNENKKYWFRNYILDDYLKKFNQFINDTKELHEKFMKSKAEMRRDDINIGSYETETNQKHIEICDEYTIMWGEMLSSIEFIKTYDGRLYKKLNDALEYLQDMFTKEIDQEKDCLAINSNSQFNMNIEEEKNKIYKILYKESLK